MGVATAPAIEHSYQEEYEKYLADIMESNRKSRQKVITRPDLSDPRFSEEAEAERQRRHMERSDKRQVKDDLTNRFVDVPPDTQGRFVDVTPNSNTRFVDIDQPTAVPSLRQGSVADVQVPLSWRDVLRQVDTAIQHGTPQAEAVQKYDAPNYPYVNALRQLGQLAPSRLLPEAVTSLGRRFYEDVLTPVSEMEEKYLAGPFRRVAFRGDPLEELAQQTPDPIRAPITDIVTHAAKVAALTLFDPLALLVPSSRIKPPMGHPTPPATPALAPSIVQEPLPGITDLAKQAQGEQLLAAREPVRPPVEYGAVSQTPEGVPYPAERVFDPGTNMLDLPESKRLHGHDLSHPEPQPTPGFLKSAEELLAEKQAAQAKAKAELEKQLASSPTPPPGPGSPELDPLVKQPEQAGPSTSAPTYTGERTFTQRDPRRWELVMMQALDALARTGPYGERLASLLHYVKDYGEQAAVENALDVRKLFAKYFETPAKVRNRLTAIDQEPTLFRKIQRLVNTSHADYGLTQKQNDAIVALLNAGLDVNKVSAKARETLPVTDPRIQALAQDYWKVATGRVSFDPRSRLLTVRDYITGKEYPVGEPSPFWPHQVIDKERLDELSEATLKKVWVRGNYEEAGISFKQFKRMLPALMHTDDPAFRLRRFAGLEHARLLTPELLVEEANSRGITEVDMLRKLGYETDTIRMPLKYNYYGFKRLATKEYEKEFELLQDQLHAEYPNSPKTKKWITEIMDRTQGISPREDMFDHNSNIYGMVQAIAYPAFLKASWRQNFMLQPTYAVLHSGFTPVVKAYWQHIGKQIGLSDAQIAEYAERSAANFPGYLTEHHAPGSALEQYAKTALELNWFHHSDMGSRQLFAMAGVFNFRDVAYQFWKNPADPKWRNFIKQYNINPEELYKDLAAQSKEMWVNGVPVPPDKYFKRVAQVAANRAAGRTGVEHLPLWASGDSTAAKMFLMLKRQIIANETNLVNMLVNAPSLGVGLKRVLQTLFGATAAGFMYNGVSNWIMQKPFMDVNESLKKAFGGREEAALFAKSLLLGLGTLSAGMALTGLNIAGGNAFGGVAYSLLGPAASTIGDELINLGVHGKLGAAIMRGQPLESPYVIYKREEQAEKEAKKHRSLNLPNVFRMKPKKD
jgi:hypothetical protein